MVSGPGGGVVGSKENERESGREFAVAEREVMTNNRESVRDDVTSQTRS